MRLLAVSTEIGGVLVVLATAITVAGALGVAWPILRSKTITTTNELLRQSLEVTRGELHELEKRCNAETSELRGQMKTLTDGFAASIASAIVTELTKSGVLPERRHD